MNKEINISDIYNFQEVESEIQSKSSFFANIDSKYEKFYILSMFPYPSGKIHMGHLRNYTIGDVIARYKRATGYNVLHPIGWDSFGLPAENAAIQNSINPKDWTYSNIATMKKQLKRLGLSYNWDREIITCDPSYYIHEQKFFLQMYEKGIAYRKEKEVNWDPVDKTVLANEQVVNGRGWRSNALIEKKTLKQWFLKITDYAEELLSELENLHEWDERVISMQKKWLGCSEGVTIEFDCTTINYKLNVFTTRPETIFGASFCAVSIDHPILKYSTISNIGLEDFISEIKNDLSSDDSTTYKIEKESTKKGLNIGIKAKHPFIDNIELPIYVVNFVVSNYGSGAIFGCPAHDKRDFEFAEKYNLPIINVIKEITKKREEKVVNTKEASGTMYNSGFLNGLDILSARKLVINRIENLQIGKYQKNYKIHDWGISRQRYWGCPIPIIYCDTCGIIPVPYNDLPVILPDNIDFSIDINPLANNQDWINITCPTCKNKARRETDTFDTFFESSWYFVAFCNMNRDKLELNKEECDYFLPVDCYIGGIEHAVMHLLYARFFIKVLNELGYLNIREPFKHLITQGMVCHKTYKDKNNNWIYPEEAQLLLASGEFVNIGRSEKMSKSKKNLIDPQYIFDKYGADTARLFMLSDNPTEIDIEWSDNKLETVWKFINRIYRLVFIYKEQQQNNSNSRNNEDVNRKHDDIDEINKFKKIVYKFNLEIKNYKFNKALSFVHEMTNLFYSTNGKKIICLCFDSFLKIIEPFIPHLAVHMYNITHPDFDSNNLNLYNIPWPYINSDILESNKIKIAIQINGKLAKVIEVSNDIIDSELEGLAINELKNRLKPSIPQIKKIIIVPKKLVNIVYEKI